MGRRGPKPKGEFSGKTAVVSLRLQPDTRARLTTAKEASGRSFTQELEKRLRWSFHEDDEVGAGAVDGQRVGVDRLERGEPRVTGWHGLPPQPHGPFDDVVHAGSLAHGGGRPRAARSPRVPDPVTWG